LNDLVNEIDEKGYITKVQREKVRILTKKEEEIKKEIGQIKYELEDLERWIISKSSEKNKKKDKVDFKSIAETLVY